MNSDDLRSSLRVEGAQQPPVDPGFRTAVDREVRRQRWVAAAVVSPVVLVVVLAAALLLPRGGGEATLSVADGGAAGTTVPSTAAPSTTAAPTTVTPSTTVVATTPTTSAGSSTDATPVPEAPTTTAASSVPVSCGTVEVQLQEMHQLPAGAEDAYACFRDAFNDRHPVDLTVVAHDSTGGSLTQHVSATADHAVTMTASGSISMQLPAFNFGKGGGGLVPDGGGSSDADCGTITLDVNDPSSSKTAMSDPKVLKCVMAGFSGGSAHMVVAMRGTDGGVLSVTIDVDGAAHVLRISMDGTTTVQLPDHLTMPDDLMKHLPFGKMGLDGGLGGLGGDGGWGGWGGGTK